MRKPAQSRQGLVQAPTAAKRPREHGSEAIFSSGRSPMGSQDSDFFFSSSTPFSYLPFSSGL